LYEAFLYKDIIPGPENAIMISRVEDIDISASDDGRSIHIKAGYSHNSEDRRLESNIFLRTGERNRQDQ
jgi:hypothetical protein